MSTSTSTIERGFSEAERITKARAKSFAFASLALPRDSRRAAFAVYAFCRACDDAVDVASEGRAQRIAALRERTGAIFAGEPQNEPIFAAFAATVRVHEIPARAVFELIDGMERDLEQDRYATYRELESYCQQAAGTVGIMMASVFDARGSAALEAAAALGRAMQLTNVLRDVREDLVDHGRIYVPLEMLAREGVSEDDLRAFAAQRQLFGEAGEGFRRVAREIAARARLLYAWADEGVPMIPTRAARSCVRLMRSSYSEILRVLADQDWDPFAARAHAPLGRKIRAAAREATLAQLPHEVRLVLAWS